MAPYLLRSTNASTCVFSATNLTSTSARLLASGGMRDGVTITPDCAWPYDVNEQNAKNACEMFYNRTPEERARLLRERMK